MPQYAMQSLTDTDRNYIFVLNTFHKWILQYSPSLKSAKKLSYHIFCIPSTLDFSTYCSNACLTYKNLLLKVKQVIKTINNEIKMLNIKG